MPPASGAWPLAGRQGHGTRQMFMVALKYALTRRAAIALLICATPWATRADHDITYFPSFCPQEIRVEPLDRDAAAREFASKTDPLHFYVGAAPRFAGDPPSYLKSIRSPKSLIVA